MSDSGDEFEGFEVLVPEGHETRKQKQRADDSDSECAVESSDEVEEDQDLVESDSEPENVGFGESKESTLRRVREAMTQIQTDKQRSKLKRKQRDELFKSQKLQKQEALEKKKLPDDFLAEVTTPLNKPETDDIVDSDPDVEERLHDSGSDSERELSEEENEDFIPLNQETTVKAACQTNIAKSQSSAQKAADFRQNWLYGNRLKRQSVKELKAIQHKKAMHKSSVRKVRTKNTIVNR